MLKVLDSGSRAFTRFFESLIDRRRDEGQPLDRVVAKIMTDVRRGGDRALIDLTWRFDHVRLTPARLRVGVAELATARAGLAARDRRALELAARRIERFHRRTIERSFSYHDSLRMRLGQIVLSCPGRVPSGAPKASA